MKTYIDEHTESIFEFDQRKLVESYKNYAQSQKITQSELNQRLAKSLKISDESIRKHIAGKNYPNDILTVYGYGRFLEHDRYAFLTLSKTKQILVSQEDFLNDCIQTIQASIIAILYEYASTHCFVNNKKTVEDADMFFHYRHRIDAIEMNILQIHGHENIVRKLFDITTAVKQFICSCEIPGVPERWYEVNPVLKFYSADFYLCIRRVTAFRMAVKNRRIRHIPTEEEKEECKKYFKELAHDNSIHNYKYNIDDYYQRELVKTVYLLFEQL